jgi:hypothetical protein
MTETDYLVKGAGASAMAFVDVMLRETDATFTIVDRRHAPGGHWNDAYPFVRLHQPSAYYGVSSRQLGRGLKDEIGFNKGLYELASGVEVTNYFHQVMRDDFLPSGRVNYHPMSEIVGEGEIVSLLSGERRHIAVKRKVVDATILQTSIPLTHKREFVTAEGVACIPPNDLTRLASNYRHFTVLGAGKTGIDSALWLLSNGVAPEAIAWVVPRDPWMLNRVDSQPGQEFFGQVVGGMATQYEIAAAASSIRDLCERMEAAGRWLRLDRGVWPSMFHAAIVSVAELNQLRRIPNVIRMGRVQRINPDRIVLDGGESLRDSGTLYIDCTARALAHNVNNQTPVFSPGRIALQMIRQFQPTFSAALIGHLEATVADEAVKRKLTNPVPMTNTVEDWVKGQIAGLSNQFGWSSDEKIRAWLTGCRLNAFGATTIQVREDDAEKQVVLQRMRANASPALQNLQRLTQGEMTA